MPGGKLPGAQTVEGGAQIRVTPQGFATLTSIVKPMLNAQLQGGFCIPADSAVGVGYCGDTQGPCVRGCRVSPVINTVTIGPHPTNPQAVHLHVDAKATAAVPLDFGILGSCTIRATVEHVVADLDVTLGVNAATGELAIHANPISGFSNTDPNLEGCSIISSLASFLAGLFHDTLSGFIRDQLTPAVDNLLGQIIPSDPSQLGLVGTLDLGNLLAGLSSSSSAKLEARILPGGYVRMNGNGLSLGVITGLNSDRDPATRTAALASEPARCVPALPAPSLGAAPYSLPPTTGRPTFRLGVADAFNGIPSDPGADVAMGISQTTLELAGHHLVTSGALCLNIGTSLVRQLNVGTIGLLVRSIGELQSERGSDPLLLVTRPQRAVRFSIGDNAPGSPALTVGVDHLEMDFYAFLYERYVRLFTVDASLNVGVNVDFQPAPGGQIAIKPTLVGIEPSDITIKVLNAQFVKETPAQLEAVLPSVFSLVTPLLGNLPEITVPSFAGFALTNLSVHRIATNQDDFLALYAQLGASPMLNALAAAEPGMASAVSALAAPSAPAISTGRARLAGVTTPEPALVRAALEGDVGGALPRVAFEVDAVDAGGRPLEWSYQLDGGLWRTWRTPAPGGALVIEDSAFAWQGKYTIGLKSRVQGDYRTVSAPVAVPVIIDSVAPRLALDEAGWLDDVYAVRAFDLVSGAAVSYALGRPGSAAPASAWRDAVGGEVRIERGELDAFVDHRGQLAVFARDEAGNTSITLIAPTPVAGGCTAARGGVGGAVLLLAVGLLLGGTRRERARRIARRSSWVRGAAAFAWWATASVVASLQPGCSCGHAAKQPDSCELVSDCSASACNRGELPFCIDHTCLCSSDIPPGQIGPYSDVAIGPDGSIWVSAYAQSHGDLVVARVTGAGRIPDDAWEWVDGVPDGPVTVPDSTIRHGIDAEGPDVGMYTSIAVGPDGAPMVVYFDRDTGSLKLAQKLAGQWQIQVVDAGTSRLGDAGVLAGMYASLTLRTDDGRPGIAYLAHVKDARGTRAEVRFVSAQTPHPQVPADWQRWVVDTAPLPAADPMNPPIFPLPEGLGLFIDAARLPTQAPVVAYYDRSNGDLKVARFNVQTGQFATARVLDGSGVDAGWSPSIAIDARGVVHVAYVGTTGEQLKYVTDATGAVPEVIDDGLRFDGVTADGLPKPVFHFVGSDAGIALPPANAGPVVAYQDATTQELLLAHKQPDGKWTHISLAGATAPWPGGYGFFASTAASKDQLVLSSWVVNVPAAEYWNSNWVEVFTRSIAIP